MTLTTRMSLRRLRKRKLSVALSSFIIAWAMAMMIAGVFSSEILENSSAAYLDDMEMPDLFVSLSEGRSTGEVQGVLSSSTFETYDLRLRTNGRAVIDGLESSIVLVGLSDPDRTDINRLTLLEGRMFTAANEGVMVAGSKDVLGMVEVMVNGLPIELNITGTVRSSEFLLNELQAGSIVPGSGGMTIIYLPLTTLQSAFGPVVNDILVMLDGSISREGVDAALTYLPVSSMTYREDHQTTVVIQMGVDKFKVMLPSISLVFIFIGLISIFITMYRMVLSDSRNIGVLMSIGIDRWRIARSYLAIGATITLLGGGLGVLMGYGFTVAVSSLALDMMGGIPVVIPFDPLPFLLGLVLTASAVLFAVLVPVGMVLRRSINDALRYVPRRRIWVWNRSSRSLAVSLGARNLFREPRRAIVVLMAIGLSIGAAGSWVLMVDSTQTYFEQQISAQKWDVQVTFNEPLDNGQAIMDFTNGQVSMVVPYVTLTGVASSLDGSTGAAVTAASDLESVRTFDLRGGSLDLNGAIIAKKLADELKVGPGDQISLDLGGRSVELLVTGEVNDLQTNAIYTSNSSVTSWLGEGLCQGIFVILDSHLDSSGYVSFLVDDPRVSGIELRKDAVSSLNDLFQGSISLLYAFFGLNLLIALAVAVSATIISTTEREMEFTAISSLGIPRTFIWRSLAIETGLLAAISAVLAIPFAFILALGFAILLEDAVFYIPIGLSIASIMTVLVVGWLFIWPSIIWPIRWVKKLNIARLLRERGGG